MPSEIKQFLSKIKNIKSEGLGNFKLLYLKLKIVSLEKMKSVARSSNRLLKV